MAVDECNNKARLCGHELRVSFGLLFLCSRYHQGLKLGYKEQEEKLCWPRLPQAQLLCG